MQGANGNGIPKVNTPNPATNINNFLSMIAGAGNEINRNSNAALNCTTADPYAYLRW
jgi:hypothetical protein